MNDSAWQAEVTALRSEFPRFAWRFDCGAIIGDRGNVRVVVWPPGIVFAWLATLKRKGETHDVARRYAGPDELVTATVGALFADFRAFADEARDAVGTDAQEAAKS